MNVRFVDKLAFDVVGWSLRTTTTGGKNQRDIPQFWDECTKTGKVAALMTRAGAFGILGVCANFDGETFTYLIGVEPSAGGKAFPEGTMSVKLPAASYAVFGCVGAMPDAIQKGWRTVMDEWLPTSDFQVSDPTSFELYPSFPQGDNRGDPASPACYTEIWLPVIKK